MNSSARPGRRSVVLVVLMGLLASMSLFLAVDSAQANHGSRRLDVYPEDQTVGAGAQVTLTARLCAVTSVNQNPCDPHAADVASGAIPIDFELEPTPTGASVNDPDGGASYQSPDLTCTIIAGQSECSVTYTATNVGGGPATDGDQVRAWIDHDGANSSVEADTAEGKNEAAVPGAGCSVDLPPSPEPDCTDVVGVDIVQGAPARLDCDDSTGPDTEREVNPTGGGAQSNEVYTCRATDAQGNPTNGPDPEDPASDATVKAEVETNVNDPDEVAGRPGGASYDTPDYQCVLGEGTNPDGQCQITVTQNQNEQGTASICFWIGSAAQGATLCADEPTGENQSPDGSDSGNDLADRTELTWQQGVFQRLECEPESDTNPVGAQHTVTCTATNAQGGRVSGLNVDVEATGANDPDNANSPTSPDFTCTTRTDDPLTPTVDEAGTCTFTHGGGNQSTGAIGVTTYRAWIDADNNDATAEADATEGRDEAGAPGSKPEPDDTDVVEKTWVAEPRSLTIEPETDTATVGECNPYTITVRNVDNQGVQGATVDVEQRHERAQNNTANDEPRVSFCTPASGPNPSDVDQARGDLNESPDNVGTAGGETVQSTDAQGRITIGIRVEPANGSDGSGRVDIVAFYETADNDDADAGEPQDTATKTWQRAEGRTIDCAPPTDTNPPGTTHEVTCTVEDRAGNPVAGEGVTFAEEGPGTFVGSNQATTDAQGQVRATTTSQEEGTQTITATLDDDLTGNEPNEVDECDRAAGDPQGAPAGNCSDTVTKTWGRGAVSELTLFPREATNRPGRPHTFTASVVDADGNPVEGATITWSEDGPGEFTSTETTTDANGRARATVNSDEEGDQTVTATATPCAPNGDCSDSAVKHWDRQGCSIVGTEGNDVLEGTGGDDIICGLGGDDTISGGGGNDTLLGQAGKDRLRGGSGRDTLIGARGHDTLQGGSDRDTLKGNKGNDTLRGGKGPDTLQGGNGSDIVRGGRGHDTLKGGRKRDLLNGGRGTDACRGGPGRDEIRNCER